VVCPLLHSGYRLRLVDLHQAFLLLLPSYVSPVVK
jgi:hypothetical protein